MSKLDATVDLLKVVASQVVLLLFVVIGLIGIFSSTTSSAEDACMSYLAPEGRFHSSWPYQERTDAIVVAFYERKGSARKTYAGCVVKDGEVDLMLTETMFDEQAQAVQRDCIYGNVQGLLARNHRPLANGSRWVDRPPSEAEITQRQQRCTFEYAKSEVHRKLWASRP